MIGCSNSRRRGNVAPLFEDRKQGIFVGSMEFRPLARDTWINPLASLGTCSLNSSAGGSTIDDKNSTAQRDVRFNTALLNRQVRLASNGNVVRSHPDPGSGRLRPTSKPGGRIPFGSRGAWGNPLRRRPCDIYTGKAAATRRTCGHGEITQAYWSESVQWRNHWHLRTLLYRHRFLFWHRSWVGGTR